MAERGSRGGAAAEVAEAIRSSIREGVYRPGQRLPAERVLGEQLGVSRPTVREALQALATLNVLEVRRGSGVYVASLAVADLLVPLRLAIELSRPALEDLFELRLALEPLAAGLAAERATPETVARLQDCVEQSSRPGLVLERLVELDTTLHRLVVDAAGNPLLASVLASLGALSQLSREQTVRGMGIAARTRRDHRSVVAAIARGDRSRAEAAMRRHLEHVRRGLGGRTGVPAAGKVA